MGTIAWAKDASHSKWYYLLEVIGSTSSSTANGVKDDTWRQIKNFKSLLEQKIDSLGVALN